jgi:hypothetical protein
VVDATVVVGAIVVVVDATVVVGAAFSDPEPQETANTAATQNIQRERTATSLHELVPNP